MQIFREIPNLNFKNDRGILDVFELESQQFIVKRFYYISKVPFGKSRGLHGHKKLSQIFFALAGEFTLNATDGEVSNSVICNVHGPGYLLPGGYWRELNNFSNDGICLVLASESYDSSDYIYSFNEYLDWRKIERH
jgi:dTDP-4-dehydrorhamnose 3,5-epimerase-like enzyme